MNKVAKSIKEAIRSRYAWPGGYPLALLMSDGECMCMKCAKAEYKLIARAARDNDKRSGWMPEAAFINWEDDSLFCANCDGLIESAYGDDDDDSRIDN